MNTSHILPPETERFGLFAYIESRRVVLPLKGVECEFSVRGGVVEVCLNQIFRQENPKPLDCEYLFPLPADASVYFCEANVNGRIIRAEIKERAEARRLASEKKAEGFRTTLMESERDNLFTLTLGNVQPDDLIVVRLKYCQTLRGSNQTRSVEIPFCPGVRYIPGKPLLRTNKGKGIMDDTDEVPDASRITPIRIDAGHPDAAYIDVRGRLDAAYTDERSVSSPSHSIAVYSASGELCVELSAKGHVPDRDFVLRWSERQAEAVAPRGWMFDKKNESYALLEVRAPQQVEAHGAPLDFYFLVDRSGSMQGAKWTKAVEALQSCLCEIGPEDRAMVTLFAAGPQDFAERPLPACELLKDPRFQGLQSLGADGGTNLAPALQHVLAVAAKESEGRDRALILITDAQVGNETAILNLMKSAPNMPVHCFGIDTALNDALLLAMCRQQGGAFHSLHPNDDIKSAVTKLGKMLGQPALLDLELAEGWECADAKIPNLYAGQILYLSARGEREKPLELTGRTPSGERVRLKFEMEASSDETPYLQWCKSRIQQSLALGQRTEAIALSLSSNLLCPLTAFVAWDESEKVVVSRHDLAQPSMELSDLFQAGMVEISRTCRPALSLDGITATTRFCSPRPRASGGEMDIVPQLYDACLKMGGNACLPSYFEVVERLTRFSGDQLGRAIEMVKRFIQALELCAKLRETLDCGNAINGDLPARLRVCQLEFHAFQQQWKTPDGDTHFLEQLFGCVEKVDASTPPAEIAALDHAIFHHMFAALKLLPDRVSTPTQVTSRHPSS
jgi:Ca-activated chloride channel family protein